MKSSNPFGSFPESIPLRTGIRQNSSRSALRVLCIAVIALGILVVMPALGGTKYTAGSPELNAHIAGTNEFSPGDDVNLQVVVGNTGLVQFRIVQSGIISPADLPNTAKQLTATLGTGNAPLVVKADPQALGDLAGGSTTVATFHIKINSDAAAGTYVLPLHLNYTYLYQQEQTGTDTISYVYKDTANIISIPIKIKSDVQIDVTNVTAESLNAGNEGYIDLTVKNVGYENGRNATIRIQSSGQSPVTPVEGGVYVGDFPSGSSVDSRLRVSVSSDAQQKSYPLDVFVNYKNSDGDFVDSKIETIGVPVGQKVAFNVTTVTTSVPAGGKSVIKVMYQNTGGATAYNALARISAVDPFTSNDDTSFLGTMAPGEVREAAFEVSVDAGATIKEYGLDSEIVYRDSLNNQFTSDPVKVNVGIVKAKSLIGTLGLPGLLVIVLVIIAAAGYFVYTRRIKPQ